METTTLTQVFDDEASTEEVASIDHCRRETNFWPLEK